jgi:hypothetical protein
MNVDTSKAEYVAETNFYSDAGRTWRSLWKMPDGTYVVREVWYGNIMYWVKDPVVYTNIKSARIHLDLQRN